MYECMFLRKHKLLVIYVLLISLLSVPISYAVSIDDIEISGFSAKDTARGDLAYFEADMNNIGAYHVYVRPYVTVFSQGAVIEEISGSETQMFSHRSKKIRVTYNTSALDIGQYTAMFWIVIDGQKSEVIEQDFNVLELYQSVIIRDLDVEPTELGEFCD